MTKYAYGPADKPPMSDEMKSLVFAIVSLGVVLLVVAVCCALSVYT